jgi:hypothetical protein
MALHENESVTAAQNLARQAEELTGKMKVGGWESIQALALISIAKSLAVIAAGSAGDQQR